MRNRVVAIALLLPLSTPFAGDNAWFTHGDSCLKYPPSDARTQCIKMQREAAAEFEKARRREEAASKNAEEGLRPKNDLCFTRTATAERVCPN